MENYGGLLCSSTCEYYDTNSSINSSKIIDDFLLEDAQEFEENKSELNILIIYL